MFNGFCSLQDDEVNLNLGQEVSKSFGSAVKVLILQQKVQQSRKTVSPFTFLPS